MGKLLRINLYYYYNSTQFPIKAKTTVFGKKFLEIASKYLLLQNLRPTFHGYPTVHVHLIYVTHEFTKSDAILHISHSVAKIGNTKVRYHQWQLFKCRDNTPILQELITLYQQWTLHIFAVYFCLITNLHKWAVIGGFNSRTICSFYREHGKVDLIHWKSIPLWLRRY